MGLLELNCFKTKRSFKSFVDDQPCIGFSPPLLKLLSLDIGHRLFVTIHNGLPLVFCNICGYYASSKPKCLLEQCPGKVMNAEALKRLNSHHPRHPARNCFLPRPFPVARMSLSSMSHISASGHLDSNVILRHACSVTEQSGLSLQPLQSSNAKSLGLHGYERGGQTSVAFFVFENCSHFLPYHVQLKQLLEVGPW